MTSFAENTQHLCKKMLISVKDLGLLADPEAWCCQQKMKSVLRLNFSWPILIRAGRGGAREDKVCFPPPGSAATGMIF